LSRGERECVPKKCSVGQTSGCAYYDRVPTSHLRECQIHPQMQTFTGTIKQINFRSYYSKISLSIKGASFLSSLTLLKLIRCMI
jgi:hypothetical protein